MSARAWLAAAIAALGVSTGCGLLDDPPRSATSTPVRLAVARVPTSGPPTPTVARSPTRAVPTATVTSPPLDEAQIQQSVAETRAAVERVLRNGALPDIEGMLVETVALATPSGGEQLQR